MFYILVCLPRCVGAAGVEGLGGLLGASPALACLGGTLLWAACHAPLTFSKRFIRLGKAGRSHFGGFVLGSINTDLCK